MKTVGATGSHRPKQRPHGWLVRGFAAWVEGLLRELNTNTGVGHCWSGVVRALEEKQAAPTPPRRWRSTTGSWGKALCTANKGHGGRRKDGPFQNCLFCFFSLVNVKIQNSERCSSMGLGSKNRQPAKKPLTHKCSRSSTAQSATQE